MSSPAPGYPPRTCPPRMGVGVPETWRGARAAWLGAHHPLPGPAPGNAGSLARKGSWLAPPGVSLTQN